MAQTQAKQAAKKGEHPSPPIIGYHQELVQLQAWAQKQLETGALSIDCVSAVVTAKLGYNCELSEFVKRRFWY